MYESTATVKVNRGTAKRGLTVTALMWRCLLINSMNIGCIRYTPKVHFDKNTSLLWLFSLILLQFKLYFANTKKATEEIRMFRDVLE